MPVTKPIDSVLLGTTARQVMHSEIVALSTEDPVSAAVKAFEEYHITGAPVVDAAGSFVGVLSVADIARSDHVRSGQIASERYEYYLANPLEEQVDDRLFGDEEILAKADYSDAIAGEHRVGDWMTPKLITCDPDDNLVKLCRVMTEEEVHRVLLTEENQVLGIVSAFDIVKYIASNV